jgi:iron complex transport system ATP-binding protein
MSAALQLEASAVRLARGGRPVLEAVDVALEPGRFTAIMGPNGCGKSTLLDVLAGYLRPQAGQARLCGRPLTEWPGEALSLRRMVLSQSLTVSAPFSVRQVVELGVPRECRLPGEQLARYVERALERVDLAPLIERSCMALSGGELQRVHFARCLLQLALMAPDERAVLLLDEPTSHQDMRHQESILSTCRQLAADGHLVCAVLHDVNQVSRFADSVLLLQSGRVVLHLPTQQALADPRFAGVFRVRLTPLENPRGAPAWYIDATDVI